MWSARAPLVTVKLSPTSAIVRWLGGPVNARRTEGVPVHDRDTLYRKLVEAMEAAALAVLSRHDLLEPLGTLPRRALPPRRRRDGEAPQVRPR